MENNELTPEQWESKYMSDLGAIVGAYNNYMDNVTANMKAGVFYNTQMIYDILTHIKQESATLKNYAVTVKWFTDRNLHNLENYIVESQKGLDELITIYTQTYDDDNATTNKINEMWATQHQAELDSFKTLQDTRRANMDAINAQFLAYIRSN